MCNTQPSTPPSNVRQLTPAAPRRGLRRRRGLCPRRRRRARRRPGVRRGCRRGACRNRRDDHVHVGSERDPVGERDRRGRRA